MNKEKLQLYAITDWRYLNGRSKTEAVLEACKGGITMLQLRDKEAGEDELISEALLLKPICEKYGIPLIINDNPHVDYKVKADGVHLGQKDGSIKDARRLLGTEAIIGATAHNLTEALRAEEDVADYLGVGAAFPSITKSDTVPVTTEMYKEITGCVNIPVVAIGGIGVNNINELSGTGVAGIAVISAIFNSDNISESAKKLLDLSQKYFY